MGDRPDKIVIFGAGNIGRSFIGYVFSRAGWEVVFIDVDKGLVAELSRRREYDVVIKRDGGIDETIKVKNIRAVDGRDIGAVAAEFADARLIATAVGKAALPFVIPAVAAGLLARGSAAPPLDLILAENDREARETMRSGLARLLPKSFDVERRLGLVETSIGKMVPLMRREDLASDRLRIFAEAYNNLIVDRRGFLNPLPAVRDLCPVDNIAAYVDRKLFVHNLGHAAVAYLGYRADPSVTLICEAMKLPGVRDGALCAMSEASAALALEYPLDLSETELEKHVADLMERFGNRALGDTVFRVGKDIPRKLSRSDRIVGAALLCERHGLSWTGIAKVFRAALAFGAANEDGSTFPADESFRSMFASRGLQAVLTEVCGLDRADPVDARVFAKLS